MVNAFDHSGLERDPTLFSDDLALLSRVARCPVAGRNSSSAKWDAALGRGRQVARRRGKRAAVLFKQSGNPDSLVRVELGRKVRAEGSTVCRRSRQHARRVVLAIQYVQRDVWHPCVAQRHRGGTS